MNRWWIVLMAGVVLAGLWFWLTTPPQPTAPPLPKVQGAAPSIPSRAGESQPLAPGFKPAPPLPEIALAIPIPELRRLEYASNGFIEAAL